MKKIYKFIIVLFLLIVLVYVSNITQIPQKLILFQGEKLKLNLIAGLSLTTETPSTLEASANFSNELEHTSEEIGRKTLQLSLFNTIPIKKLTVNVIPKTKVIPVGKTVGLKLYTKGVLVVGINENDTFEGMQEGDTIVKINEKDISTTEELVKSVNESNRRKHTNYLFKR